MNIAGIDIGRGHPCRVVAEISNNHNGDVSRALRLIDAAKTAGADFVKFQCYTPDELVALRGDGPAPEPWGAQGWTMRTLYEKAATPLEWFPALFAHAREIGIVPFSSVFGAESLAVLEAVECPAYKISKFERGARNLILSVAALRKPVLMSSGSNDYGAVVMDPISPPKWVNVASLLYCPGGYPCLPSDVRLPYRFCDREYNQRNAIGLSSHCLDPRLPIAAVARGAKLIEMHMMLESEPSELESNVSLTEKQMARIIEDIRATEVML